MLSLIATVLCTEADAQGLRSVYPYHRAHNNADLTSLTRQKIAIRSWLSDHRRLVLVIKPCTSATLIGH